VLTIGPSVCLRRRQTAFSLKLKRSNKQDATCKLQQATCKKSYYNYHKTCKLQEKRRGYFNAQLSVAISLPCRLKLKLCSYSCNLSRAVMRVGEWLQQIAHLNIFKHAEKMIMSLQQVCN
jgi:hypothetical protein